MPTHHESLHQQHILQNEQKQPMKFSGRGVPMKCHPLSTSPTLMNIKLCNFNACYNTDVTKRLRMLEDTPSTCGLIENLALIEPNDFEMKNKYFCRRDDPTNTPARFFLVGTVTNSSLLSGDISRNISVSFSNRTFPRAIAAIGEILHEKVLFLPTFQQGVSITTARKLKEGTSQTTIRGLTPSSHRPRQHDDIEQALLPWDAKVPVYNGTKPFLLSQYKNQQQIVDELTPNSAVIAIFTLTTFPYHRLSSSLSSAAINTSLTFNIQSIIWLAYPSKDATVDPSLAPSPAIGVTDDYLVNDIADITQPDIILNENEGLI
ncbi:uncharacterized protein LACBIDRAFT_296918 [Laccaria bicolor S238N-H82]|uniref:Predicted protein n=1 Tax=Laccaria bicolor (strain S238N-H82 / ATCC MYA-4686) TaxID=486041 RepID=B0D9K1_LACBS|nr:uncharacterized protein LACBIDRAFT_296918 [Laccaria bicolor S238N-H82]EDR08594.1 predicted protein [Laccaria bicolor S238N-H82]|eukprot:XP_001880819.1 predicted protein [Laccaria bicolor S238N-H82]